MDIKSLKNTKTAVLGYGQEGKAIVKYLMKHGVKPVLFDQKPWEKWTKKEQNAIKKLGIGFIFGPDCFKKLKDFDVAFRSPGIPLSHPDLIKWMNNNLSPYPSPSLGEGRPIMMSQTKWFFEHCPAKTIGVTGTKGKGTTASLIAKILNAECRMQNKTAVNSSFSILHSTFGNIYLTGNIGKEQPLIFLDRLKPNDWVVYELSSFQLQDLKQSPHIGVVLMTTKEHLDYHKDEKEYTKAKEPILKFQKASDFAIINSDYPASVKIGKLGKGKKIFFSTKRSLRSGCFVNNNDKIVVKNIRNKNFQFPRLRRGFDGQAIFNFQLRGRHNLENICAATIAALCAGINKDTIISTVNNFKGLEHRLEFVAEKKGIKFYNDSYSTIPETAIAAVKSFTQPLILILGGSSKKSDFTNLAKTIHNSKNIRAIILIGSEATKIKKTILLSSPSPGHSALSSWSKDKGRAGRGRTGENKKLLIFEGAKNMHEIFKQIKQIARAGDAVLLSPACASFDMFKNYQDRGEQFKICAHKF